MRTILLLTMSLLMAGVPIAPLRAEEESSVTEEEEALSYDSVCLSGELPSRGPDINVLPKGFHGNYKETGIYEIGYKAGDEDRNDTLPLLDLNKEDDYYFTFLITFTTDPEDFPQCKEKMNLGFEFVTVDEEGNEFISSVMEECDCFYDLFTIKGTNVDKAKCADDDGQGMLSIHHKTNSVGFSVMISQEDRIKYLRVYYGDVPQEVVSAVLCVSYNHLSAAVESPYPIDCSKHARTVETDDLLIYDFDSNQGTLLSPNYLMDQFSVHDSQGDVLYDIIGYEDVDDYYKKGKEADIGSVFNLNLYYLDSEGTKKDIQLRITIVDKKAPVISQTEDGEITESYTTDLNSQEFLDRHFRISDNSGTAPQWNVSQENGMSLPVNEIGKFRMVLEATDDYGNATDYPFVLSLIDDVGPVLISDVDEITITDEEAYSEKKLLSLFSSEDAIDGKCDVELIENEYEGNENVQGRYLIKAESQDKSGNKSEKEIILYVKGTESETFSSKKSYLTLTQGEIPDLSEIVSSLIRQEVIPDENYVDYEIIEGEEIDDDTSPGIYEITLLLISEDDEETSVDLTVKVLEKEKDEKNIFDIILEFFMNLFNMIIDFFKSLFS